jgi:hypothetical protein
MVVGLLLLSLLIAGCNGETEPCPTAEPCPECPAQEPCPECPAQEPCPTAEACPEGPEGPEPVRGGAAAGCPFEEQWAGSPHADAEAEAFVHWDEDDPAEVPTSCAKCHSEGGMIDFVGADGTEAGVVDNAAAIGTVVSCNACHNEATLDWDTVVFPSGAEIMPGDSSALCMECHQGRASKASVDNAIAEAGLEDMDTTSEDLGFTNIHYFAAAATLYGTMAEGGYQYEGKSYDAKLSHVSDYDTCVECHNQHTLELRMDECAVCHTESDPKEIRMEGSEVDYDGDGDIEEGIAGEIEGMQEALYGAMQAYGQEVAGTPIVYDAASYPYFFDDAGERFASWTGRLAKAAYNYQLSLKDPGAYAHGGKYIIQLLYDSVEDLNTALSSPIDMSAMHRIDHGHFAGSEEAFRHWDEDGAVDAGCATCHSADGLPFFIEHGVQIEQELSNGFECETCHTDLQEFTVYEIEEVAFPSGATVSAEDASNLCMTCHQGRSSAGSVDRAVEGMEPDVPAELRFINVHYFAAGATLFGSETQGAYQYPDKEYLGRFEHVDPYNTCVECHNIHALTVKTEDCTVCHAGIEEAAAIRIDETDYDGDGDTEEGIAGEIETMAEALYAAMQDYAASTEGVSPIEYNPARYPYYFDDAGESYATWTPTLLKAAYNYQYVQKDPGAFAHNAKYIIQVLYDSIEATGGDVGAMTRP